MLHRIWLGFFLVAFISALYQWLGLGDAAVFQRMVTALFDMAGLSVDLAIGLVGLMALWLGIVAIGEASGVVEHAGEVVGQAGTAFLHGSVSLLLLVVFAHVATAKVCNFCATCFAAVISRNSADRGRALTQADAGARPAFP